VANAIPPQSATVGQAFAYAIPANTFTDKETPNSLTLTVTGLPSGLLLVNNTISGMHSAVVDLPLTLTLTVTATDPGGLSVNTPLLLTISPAPAPANTPPTVANAIPPQSATVGQAFAYAIPANTFTDKETPTSLTLTVTGLPSGLALANNNTITGTPSTTLGSPFSLTVTATDPGGLSVNTPLLLTISPAAVTNPTPFTITSVNTLSCVAISATERRVSFLPAYAGRNGSAITFSVVNELTATLDSGPYTLRLYTDNPIITLRAQQNGLTASFAYNWLAACNPSPNLQAPLSASAIALEVTPGACNPTTNQYSLTGNISLTAALSGTLTITDGTSTTTVAIADGQTLARFTLTGLPSGTDSHTVTITGTDYPTTSATYTAPASCTVDVSLTATPTTCSPATNTYNVNGILSLANAPAGTATITDGATSTTVAVAAGATSLPYALTGFSPGTGVHTITVTFAGITKSITYNAPASCDCPPAKCIPITIRRVR
jgi:hypothetical protein